jgi:hypothetical protein
MARQHKMITKTDKRPATVKRAYRRPVLTAHGNLRRLANAKGSTGNDGAGKPRTKAGGPAA